MVVPSISRRRVSDHGGRLATSGGGGGFQHRPTALICQGCGGQYFAASLPIHQKTCFERNPFVDIACPTCRVVVKSGSLRAHVDACDGLPQATSYASLVAKPVKPEAAPEELDGPEADGRVRCRKCDRAFHADRIAKHQSVCAGTRRRVPGLASRTASCVPVQANPVGVRAPIPSASPPRRRSYVTRIRSVSAVSVEFAGASVGASVSQSSAWGRDRETKRFDLVHRDGTRRAEAPRFRGGGGRLNLSMSMATSASNPLATNRAMTLSSW